MARSLALAVLAMVLAKFAVSLQAQQQGRPNTWTEPEVIAEHVAGGRVGVPVRGLADPDRGLFVVWSEGQFGAWSVFVAARDDRGRWHKTRLTSTSQVYDPEPQIARAADRTLLVAWGGSGEKPGGGFCILKAGSEKWTRPQVLHARCEGAVALSGGKQVAAVYIRPVTKVDLKRVFGDFVHDRPVQGFDKPAIASFDGTAWNETAVLETKNLFRCCKPMIAERRGVAYFREPDDGPAELAWSGLTDKLTGKGRPEIISRSPDFRFGTEAAVAAQNGQPVIAFHDEKGVVLVRGTKQGFGKPMLLHGGEGFGIRVAATPVSIHVAFAAAADKRFRPLDKRIRHIAVTDPKEAVLTKTITGWTCDLCLDQERPVLFVSQQEKVTDVVGASYRLLMTRRGK